MENKPDWNTCFRYQELMKDFRQYGLRVHVSPGGFHIECDVMPDVWHMHGHDMYTLEQLQTCFHAFEAGLKLAGKVTRKKRSSEIIDIDIDSEEG